MRHLSRAVAATVTLTVIVTACSASERSAPDGGSTAAADQGGTFRVLATRQEVALDPARSQSLSTGPIHLVVRALTSWKTSPDRPAELVPDLATDLGRPSDGGKTWTYNLKPGLTYADGSPVVAADIKYGVERSFAAELSGGLAYHKSLLANAARYGGPYQGDQLASVEAPDSSTVVFNLNRPFGDWPWIAGMPAFSPVPKRADANPARYGERPMATGPYQVRRYVPGSKLELERNPSWNRANDPARTGLPDSVVFELALQSDVVTQRLIADTGDDRAAASVNASVPAALIPALSANPAVKARVVTSLSGALYALAMNNRRPALSKPEVRKAIQYAVDKQSVQVAKGGPEYGGEIATTLIPPGVDGYTKYDLYPAPPQGDPEKAKAILAAAGASNLNLVMAADNQQLGLAQAIQQGLERVGITVTIKPYESSAFYELIGADEGDYDLATATWQPNYPSALASIQPLFASSEIGKGGFNVIRYSNPAVDTGIAAASAELDRTKAAGLWAALDRQIMADAPMVPLIYARNTFLHGSKVQNFYLPSYPPAPNLLTIGLKK